jgi:hypothetical protein
MTENGDYRKQQMYVLTLFHSKTQFKLDFGTKECIILFKNCI